MTFLERAPWTRHSSQLRRQYRFHLVGAVNAATGTLTLAPLSLITGIPSPYAVSTCPTNTHEVASVLVTSPSDNSVRVLTPSIQPGTFPGAAAPALQTGSQPYSVACTGGLGGANGTGVVSNRGDNTLTVFDVASLQVVATIPGVPGARGFHGIAVSITGAANQNSVLAWVAGTDVNVVTVVDLVHSTVLAQFPISSPTAVLANAPRNTIYVAGAGEDSITAYDASTISRVNNQFAGVTNPQDFTFSPLLGDFALSGPHTLWTFNLSDSASTGPIASVSGATALAAPYFTADSPEPPCCALVLATSTSTNRVYLIQPAPAMPSQFTIQNAASFRSTGAAPGSLAAQCL
jgi:hypothetical protein